MKKNNIIMQMQYETWLIKGLSFLIILASILIAPGCSKKTNWIDDPASFVNPFIGTEGERSITDAANTVPGAVTPFGMLSFGPETTYSDDMKEHRRYKMVEEGNYRIPVSPGGYNYAASRLKGFSLTRLSGTGCMGASGDVPLLPFTDEIKHSPDNDPVDKYYSAAYSHDDETARPGYYGVKLDNGIKVELTATARTGFARIKYLEDKSARLLVRTSYSQLGSGDAYTKIDLEKQEVSGHVVSGNFCGYLGGYNRRDYYTLYFVIKFDRELTETGSWHDENVQCGSIEAKGGMPYGERGIPKTGKGSGVWLGFNTNESQTLKLRIGISYVSLENARLNLETEQSENENFESVADRAYEAWNQSLSKIQVESADTSLLTSFYSALYHTQFHPNVFSDVNGEYAGFDGSVHKVNSPQKEQYANFSGWDVYRSQLQLISLTQPERANDIAQSLFNQSKQYQGIWDRWTHNNGPTAVMCGDPASIAIANFAAFGNHQFEVESAYQSLAKASKIPTEFDLSPVGKPIFSRGQKPSLDQWLELGYISDSCNAWEGASETLEQSSAYFALSQLAKRLGHKDDYHLFLKQSSNWKNLFNPNATEEEGYIQGKNFDGSWKEPFDPHAGWLFVEGSPLQYVWMIPFDGSGLFEKMGGPEKAADRLDRFFKKEDGSWALYRSGGAYSDVSNQPSINAPWMYLFTGKAYKTQETVRAAMEHLWKPTTTGIPGQDDLGQMSSWYVFSALGMYPLYPGRADMVLGSPAFANAIIHRKDAEILIEANNASPEHIYVQSLSINKTETNKSWVPEELFIKKIILDFEMSDQVNKHFGDLENKPPSYSK